MSSTSEIASKLQETSQIHEKEIVIDFGKDRIMHFLGVYVVLFLAVYCEIANLSTGK